jgi:adenylate cyclase
MKSERRLTTILAADVVGYSTLMAADEEGTAARLKRLREIVDASIASHQGRVFHTAGDSVVAEFASAVEAVRCAVGIQRELQQRNAELPEAQRMQLRVGVNLGDVLVDGDNLLGDGVNIAARLESLADAGSVYISGSVYEQVRNKVDFGFSDLGDQTVKNIPDLVRVYRVQPAEDRDAPAPGAATPRKRPRRLRTALAATAALVLLVGAGLWASWPRPLGLLIDLAGVSGLPVNPPLPDKPSLVVLPFENVSGDPEQDYFSDGITDDLINEFARNPWLFVISRNSAFTYKGKRVKVEDVGRELGVRYVLEGSVRKAGDRVRITAQLTDATTGGHLSSEQYDRDLADVFAVQSEIAEQILAAMGARMVDAEERRLARKRPQNFTAAEANWKGVGLMLRYTREDIQKARGFLERAIEVDPEYAPPYGTLGITYVAEFTNGWSRDRTLLDRAEELGRRSIEIDSSWPVGHLALGLVHFYRGNLSEAVAAADRAIDRAPSVPYPHMLRGLALAQQGRVLQATRSMRRALRLSPRPPPPLLLSVAFVNFAAGREAEAVEMMEQVRSSNPDNLVARAPLAVYYEQEGRHAEARAAVAEIKQIQPHLTADELMEIVPGLERMSSAVDHLRKAGLP